VMERDEKCGWDSSCLQSDVPKTPHPTMAISDEAGGDGGGDDDDIDMNIRVGVLMMDRDTDDENAIGLMEKAFDNDNVK
jgi:hypothetical protein